MTGHTPIRVGIAGLGRFGKLHASVLSRIPGVEIAAISDPIESERQAVGDLYGVSRRYAEVEQLFADPDIDCLYVVTPEQFHEDHARKALARGVPVFLEKPLATTSTTGAELVELARQKGIHFQVGFVLRFEMQHTILRDEIAAGRFGDLVSIRVKRNCTKDWFNTYGHRVHSVYETIIHDIDLLVWLTGSKAETVYAMERNIRGYAYPDATFAMIRFANGTIAMAETSWFVPAHAPANIATDGWYGTIDAELVIVGTEQTAELRLLDSPLNIWTNEILRVPESSLWPVVNGQTMGALREEDAHFIDCVRSGQPSGIASVADAVEGLRIAEAIVESARTGREVRLS